MRNGIYKKIVKNLLVGGSLIAIVIGLVVGLIELERIDEHVVELATDESEKISGYYHDYFYRHGKKNDTSLQTLEQAIREEISSDIFILIEIYNENKKRVIENTRADIDNVVRELENKRHSFPLADKSDYLKIFYQGQLYLKIITPILDKRSGQIIGYFEGIYHVSKDKTADITKRVIWSIAQAATVVLLTTVLLFPIILLLNRDLIKRSKELLHANVDTLNSLGKSIAKRDSDTNTHNYRVTIYAIRLAQSVGVKNAQMQSLIKGAFLHDVGKIGISDTILLKQSTLTDNEYKEMKNHVHYGIDIIQSNRWLEDARDVVKYHHEKYDGSGYLGLKAEAIPLNARIFAIADVFDALTSKRPYKELFSYEKSISIMQESARSHFDPTLFHAFEQIAKELYDEIHAIESEAKLDALLGRYIERYFHV